MRHAALPSFVVLALATLAWSNPSDAEIISTDECEMALRVTDYVIPVPPGTWIGDAVAGVEYPTDMPVPSWAHDIRTLNFDENRLHVMPYNHLTIELVEPSSVGTA